MTMSYPHLMLGDCLQRMSEIADGSIDMILCDLPYGTTQNKWDIIIPFEPLWKHYRRVTKSNAAIVLTASQPFTTDAIASNRDWFKYSLVWDKVNKYTNFLNAKIQPLKRHEDIIIFYNKQPTYNPQKISVFPYKSRSSKGVKTENYGKVGNVRSYGELITENGPCSIVPINSHFTKEITHRTQKPVALMEYLIKTYTNEGETVLDNTMGSGTTGVACVNTGRRFIGIEQDEGYYRIAQKRIADAVLQGYK